MIKKCLYCQKEITGRSDKKYCDPYCKSAYQYKKKQEAPMRFYDLVDQTLKRNRKLLKTYNKAGKTTVRVNVLIKAGFDPKFFTHYWKNQKNEVYFFVFEYGFLRKKENGTEKYVLVIWQNYMAKNAPTTSSK